MKNIQNIERGDFLKKVIKIFFCMIFIMLFTICALFVENIFSENIEKLSEDKSGSRTLVNSAYESDL